MKDVARRRGHGLTILGNTHNSVVTQPGLAVLTSENILRLDIVVKEAAGVQMLQPLKGIDGCLYRQRQGKEIGRIRESGNWTIRQKVHRNDHSSVGEHIGLMNPDKIVVGERVSDLGLAQLIDDCDPGLQDL